MAKKKPSKTANQQAYIKELKRIKRFVRRAEKRGYTFTENPIPKMPKRITKKSVERLQKIKPSDLYAKTSYYDIITDQRISGTQAQKLIRSRAAKKAAQTRYAKRNIGVTQPGKPPSSTDDVLRYVEELISNWQPYSAWNESYARLKQQDKNILQNVLNGAISQLGRNQVAKNIESRASDVKDLAFHICYGSSDFKWGDIQGDIAAITAIIYGRTLTVSESIDIQSFIDSTLNYEST